jgi:hypothetical protein
VASRVRNAQASVARIRALLSRATKLSDVVLLESEMATRQADLEALQARQRVLADQTALATLTVDLHAEGTAGPTEPDTGFLAGLAAGWDAFTGAAVVGLTALGALTPFLAIALLVLLVLLAVLRRRRSVPAPVVE